jgi:hypothetical protein
MNGTMPHPDHIPLALSEAFRMAVRRYAFGDWKPTLPEEPLVPFQEKQFSIRAICIMCGEYKDQLADDVFDALCSRMYLTPDPDKLREKLRKYQDYSIASRCLITLMDRSVGQTRRHRVSLPKQ